MYWNLIKKMNSKDSEQVFSCWGDGGGFPLLAENLLIPFPTSFIPSPTKGLLSPK